MELEISVLIVSHEKSRLFLPGETAEGQRGERGTVNEVDGGFLPGGHEEENPPPQSEERGQIDRSQMASIFFYPLFRSFPGHCARRVTTTSSGRLNTRWGIMLFPRPRLTTSSVSPIEYSPLVYWGNHPSSGAISPPTKGSRT